MPNEILGASAEPNTFDARVSVGKYTYGSQRGHFGLYDAEERIEVGSFCSIVKELIFGGGEHVVGVTSYPLFQVSSSRALGT